MLLLDFQPAINVLLLCEHFNETKPELSNIYTPLHVASPPPAMKATLFTTQLNRKSSWKDAAKMHQDGNCPGM